MCAVAAVFALKGKIVVPLVPGNSYSGRTRASERYVISEIAGMLANGIPAGTSIAMLRMHACTCARDNPPPTADIR